MPTSGASVSSVVTELLQDSEALNGPLADAVLAIRQLRNGTFYFFVDTHTHPLNADCGVFVLCGRFVWSGLLESCAREVSDARAMEVIRCVEQLIAVYRRHMLAAACSAADARNAVALELGQKQQHFAMTARAAATFHAPRAKGSPAPAPAPAASTAAATQQVPPSPTPLYTRPFSASGSRPTTAPPASTKHMALSSTLSGTTSSLSASLNLSATGGAGGSAGSAGVGGLGLTLTGAAGGVTVGECGCSGAGHAFCRAVPDHWREAHAKLPHPNWVWPTPLSLSLSSLSLLLSTRARAERVGCWCV